jgi:hypothetical protein
MAAVKHSIEITTVSANRSTNVSIAGSPGRSPPADRQVRSGTLAAGRNLGGCRASRGARVARGGGQKYSQIRESSSDAVTAANATRNAVTRSWII